LCFDYAQKIGVDQKTDIPAVGNAANHAIGAARLGLTSAIYTIVGRDDQGEKTKEVFLENNVDVSYLTFDERHGTNLSIVINFRAERTIFVYHEPRTYQLPMDMKQAAWVYVTSASGGGVEDLHAHVLEYLQKNPSVKLAFNPGTYQMRLGLQKLTPLLARSEILFLNREESAAVLEVVTHDVPALIKRFHELGVKTMVMTDGPAGSYVSDGKKIYFLDIFKGPVIERTGAGDAYGSGFLSALVHGKSITEAMLWGNGNSTSVVQYVGAREGLLTEDAMQKMIEENKAITPKVFSEI
jgi:ribokinase